jgi:hypothetical protein
MVHGRLHRSFSLVDNLFSILKTKLKTHVLVNRPQCQVSTSTALTCNNVLPLSASVILRPS